MMKKYISSYLIPFLGILSGLFVSCTDNLGEDQTVDVSVDDTNLVETQLSLNVAAMNVSSSDLTRSTDDMDDKLSDKITEAEKRGTDAERRINDIWVFQFDARNQNLLTTPRYYDISEDNIAPDETTGSKVRVLLKPDVSSIIYVIANTGDSEWIDDLSLFATFSLVKDRQLREPKPQIVDGSTIISLPMEGGTQAVTPVKGTDIDVKVTRMYAKVEITVGDIPESLLLTDVVVGNIPFYCRIATVAPKDPKYVAEYPNDFPWTTYGFDPGVKDTNGRYTKKMVLYLPENLQGRTNNSESNPELKATNANEQAFYVKFNAKYIDIFTGEEKERGRSYISYPGANNYNDYNIKRNFIYRVKLNIYSDIYNKKIPSANCFVVKPNQSLAFLPYYRTETGGGFKFTDYLDPESADDAKRINDDVDMLKNIKIIWQTKDAIGDNSKGERVWIDRLSEVNNEADRKIHVRTNKRGNALIAAYNNSGEIVWSWHIWITENEPDNVSKAIVYSTYAWNESSILNNIRVPGYAIMSCNLGALKFTPDDVDEIDPETHGMLYQWGRKDPFPPSQKGNQVDYSLAAGSHYDNDNITVVGKTSGTDTSKLFHSLTGSLLAEKNDVLEYTVQNPTVFMCGTKVAFTSEKSNNGERYANTPSNYHNEGDWMPNGLHDDELWGGESPSTTNMKFHSIANGASIFDNYGNQKSIFDPCPSGWRVPPGDLWLGFTQTGMNPSTKDIGYEEINTSTKRVGSPSAGMYMYMNDWKNGVQSFFPTQGTRIPNGEIIRTGTCGNYHNATTDENNRVNILHIHRHQDFFHVFETTYPMYYVKSVGGPIRCVREHK